MFFGLLIFFLLIIFILSIPLTLIINASNYDGIDGDIKVSWLFGLLRFSISISKLTKEARSKRQVNHSNKSLSRNKKKRLRLATNPATLNRAIRFASDIWHAIQREDVHVNMRIGLGDPADTGMLWGFVGPLSAVLKNSRNSIINIEPDFFDTTLDFSGSGKLRFYPLQLLWLTGMFMASPTIWRADATSATNLESHT